MKKAKYYIGIALVIIGIIFYLSESLFGVNLLTLIIPDTEGPVIDTSNVPSQLYVDGEFATGEMSCTDDYDQTCEVKTYGSINTSAVGVQTIRFYAIDASGNETIIDYEVTILALGDLPDPSLNIPDGYYDGIEGLSGEELKAVLNNIITGHIEFPYTDTSTDVWDIMKEADEDPNNPDNIVAFYTGLSMPKACQDQTSPPAICELEFYDETKIYEWNREHIWSKSRGDFELKEGTTSVLDMGAHTDLHHLVAAERTMNSLKSNRHFEDCHDGDDTNVVERSYGNFTCNDWEFEPRDDVKGDVARMLFYMAVRYEGEDGDMVDLEVINDPDSTKGSKLPTYGDIDDLLRWHKEDPVDEKEIRRNQIIYSYQGNRNPFIDLPELVELVWGKPEDYVN